jgi:tetratricopeptide (TPR) repeat protein
MVSNCGGSTEAKEKAVHQSDQFYEAGSIAWFEEKDVLAAIRNLTRAVEANPNNDEAHYLLGIIRMGRGENDEAEKHLLATVKLRTGTLDIAGLAGAQNNLGVLYINQKRYAEAVKLLKASSEEVMNREPWLAFGNLGWAYVEMGEYDKAIETLKRAMLDQPQYCVGLYRIGQAYYLKQDYQSALAFLKQAIQVPAEGCNQIQEAHQYIGMSNLRLSRVDDARAAFQTCVAVNKISAPGIACQNALDSL